MFSSELPVSSCFHCQVMDWLLAPHTAKTLGKGLHPTWHGNWSTTWALLTSTDRWEGSEKGVCAHGAGGALRTLPTQPILDSMTLEKSRVPREGSALMGASAGGQLGQVLMKTEGQNRV